MKDLLEVNHAGVTVTLTGGVSCTVSKLDKEISTLHKKATQQKREGKMSLAINSLKKANKRMIESSTQYPVEQWLRLPKFLQAAGRYDESLDAYRDVFKHIDFWHQQQRKRDIKLGREFNSVSFLKCINLSYVYKSLAGFYQSIGQADKAVKAERISRKFHGLWEVRKAVHDAEYEEWLQKFKSSRFGSNVENFSVPTAVNHANVGHSHEAPSLKILSQGSIFNRLRGIFSGKLH